MHCTGAFFHLLNVSEAFGNVLLNLIWGKDFMFIYAVLQKYKTIENVCKGYHFTHVIEFRIVTDIGLRYISSYLQQIIYKYNVNVLNCVMVCYM